MFGSKKLWLLAAQAFEDAHECFKFNSDNFNKMAQKHNGQVHMAQVNGIQIADAKRLALMEQLEKSRFAQHPSSLHSVDANR